MLLSRADDFLYPQECNAAFSVSEDSQYLPMTEELLQRVIRSIETRCEGGVPLDDKALAAWTDAYWAGLEEETRTLCCGGAG
jgi:serine/threonine-protein kinase TTK/MPS1